MLQSVPPYVDTRGEQLGDLMEYRLSHGLAAIADPGAQHQFGFWIDCGPHPPRRVGEMVNGFSFTHLAVSHRTERGVEFVELDLIEV